MNVNDAITTMLLRATFIPFNVDRRAATIDGPRLMQGEHKRCQLNPATVYFKGANRHLPIVFRFIFRRQTAQPPPAVYPAAASVTPLHPPLCSRYLCRHSLSRTPDGIGHRGFLWATRPPHLLPRSAFTTIITAVVFSANGLT